MSAVIKLSIKEFLYLKNAAFLSGALPQRVDAAGRSGGRYLLTVSPEFIEQFLDAFTSRLATAGFDIRYELNAEGRILEDLIDRFNQSGRMP